MLIGESLEEWGWVYGLGVHHVRSAVGGGFDPNRPHPHYTDVEGLVVAILGFEVRVEGLGVEGDGRLGGA